MLHLLGIHVTACVGLVRSVFPHLHCAAFDFIACMDCLHGFPRKAGGTVRISHQAETFYWSVLQFKPQGRFPTMDSLMQQWPEELEPLVRSLRKPGCHVDMPTAALARALCALLDIPVHADIVDSLHCFFNLFLEMKNNEMINPPDEIGMAPAAKPNFVSFG